MAIVTGAGKGIGKGIAMRFTREGAPVVLASRSLDKLSSVAQQMIVNIELFKTSTNCAKWLGKLERTEIEFVQNGREST